MGIRQILSYVFALITILLVVGVEDVWARGGRGGGGRFSGGSRYSSGSRYSGSRSSSYRSSGYRSSRYSRYGSSGIGWQTGVLAGYFIGSRRYSTRSRYYKGEEPEICTNFQKGIANGSTAAYAGKFLCPLDDLGDEYEYCCGEEGRQECCRFFDSPGRTAGVVIGVILAFGLIGLIIFCCCKQSKKKHKTKDNSHGMHSLSKTTPANSYPKTTYPPSGYPSVTPVATSGYPQAATNGYPPADTASTMPGSYPSVPPPSYDSSTALPYSPNPTELPYSPASVGFVEPSVPGAADGSGAQPYNGNPPGFDDVSGGNKYSNPNVPGQGYSAPSAPPPYSS